MHSLIKQLLNNLLGLGPVSGVGNTNNKIQGVHALVGRDGLAITKYR